jgi:hypothetical protein
MEAHMLACPDPASNPIAPIKTDPLMAAIGISVALPLLVLVLFLIVFGH